MKSLDDVVVITRQLERLRSEELDALEHGMGGKLPSSFRAWMSKHGAGLFAGCLRISDGEQLEAGALLSKPDGWTSLLRSFPNAKQAFDGEVDARDLMTLATSIDGDSIYTSRRDSSLIVVVPRHRQELVRAKDWLDALDWFWASGVYWQPAPCPWFSSKLDRSNAEVSFNSKHIDDVFEALIEGATAAGEEVVRVYDDPYGNPGLLHFIESDAWAQVFESGLAVEYVNSQKEPVSWLLSTLAAAGIKATSKTKKGPRWG
ncbi:MAG: hypothetical protein U0165_07185 [Polyangiaceae bacterium]